MYEPFTLSPSTKFRTGPSKGSPCSWFAAQKTAFSRFNTCLRGAFAAIAVSLCSHASAQMGLFEFQMLLDAEGAMWDHRYLKNGDGIVSPNRQWQAQLQADGNLCVRNLATGAGNAWCLLPAAAPAGPHIALMQRDGNLCIYASAAPAAGMPGVHCTGSNRPKGEMYALALGNDGMLAVHARNTDRSIGGAIWTSAQGNIRPELLGGTPELEFGRHGSKISQNCALYAEATRAGTQRFLDAKLRDATQELRLRIKSKGYQAQLDALPQSYPSVSNPVALSDEHRLPAQCLALFEAAKKVRDELSSPSRP